MTTKTAEPTENNGSKMFLDEDSIEFIQEVMNSVQDESVHILPKEAAREFLTHKRISLLETLREENTCSKRDLARKLDRDIKNVSNDLNILWKYSIISYTDGEGTSQIPVISENRIIIEPL